MFEILDAEESARFGPSDFNKKYPDPNALDSDRFYRSLDYAMLNSVQLVPNLNPTGFGITESFAPILQ